LSQDTQRLAMRAAIVIRFSHLLDKPRRRR
jgi:hypothetical protein